MRQSPGASTSLIDPTPKRENSMTTKSVLGTFSKAVSTARSINFGVSGGKNCETSCRHHPIHYSGGMSRNGLCYAVVVEGRADRRQLGAKLGAHESLPPSTIIGRAIVELSRQKIHGRTMPKWLRFSTNGSVPGPAAADADRRFIALLRELLLFCAENGIEVHFPAESAEKAEYYREKLGNLITIRESIQTHHMDPDTISRHPIPSGAASFTAGESVGAGRGKRKRILEAAAAAAAAWARRTGRKTIVCPAVRVSFMSRYRTGRTRAENIAWRNGAKCGKCEACALPNMDVVYPCH